MGEKSKTTAGACSRLTCEGCGIEGRLLCMHTQKHLADFAVLAVGWGIPLLAGMIGGRFWVPLAVWVALAGVFFGYVEALVLCRHCPHYAEQGFLLRCHANTGLPKIPRFDPRPMNRTERGAWLLFVAVLFLYYVPFFVVSRQWLLLVLTTWAGVVWAWTLQRGQCTRCYHLSCPVNRVPEDVKEVFYENFPDFAPVGGPDGGQIGE